VQADKILQQFLKEFERVFDEWQPDETIFTGQWPIMDLLAWDFKARIRAEACQNSRRGDLGSSQSCIYLHMVVYN